jgi:hypothetical protein
MAAAAVKFIRKNGKIIPIRGASGAGHAGKFVKAAKAARAVAGAATVGVAAKHLGSKTGVSVNKQFDLAGLGLSFASGAVAAATFGMGAKAFVAGQVGSHVLDAASIAANIKGVSGKGNLAARAKEGAKREARNQIIGWGTYGAGVLAFKGNRQAAAKYAGTALNFARKVLRIGSHV